jgi:hypothetical protein
MKGHIMKAILALLLVFVLLVGAAMALDEGVSARGICAEDGRELVEISVADEVTEVVVIPSDPQTNAIYWYPGETKTRRFWIDDESDSVYISAFGDGGNMGVVTYRLGSAGQCGRSAAPEIERNECLGMAYDDFVNMIGFVPNEAGFVVDGNSYSFNDTLTFLVPVDAVCGWAACAALRADGRECLYCDGGLSTIALTP